MSKQVFDYKGYYVKLFHDGMWFNYKIMGVAFTILGHTPCASFDIAETTAKQIIDRLSK